MHSPSLLWCDNMVNIVKVECVRHHFKAKIKKDYLKMFQNQLFSPAICNRCPILFFFSTISVPSIILRVPPIWKKKPIFSHNILLWIETFQLQIYSLDIKNLVQLQKGEFYRRQVSQNDGIWLFNFFINQNLPMPLDNSFMGTWKMHWDVIAGLWI